MDKGILSIISYLRIIGITLITLKLSNNLQWSWWDVLAPLIFAGGLVIIKLVVVTLIEIKRTIKNKSWEE